MKMHVCGRRKAVSSFGAALGLALIAVGAGAAELPVPFPSALYGDTVVNVPVSGPVRAAAEGKVPMKALIVDAPKYGVATVGSAAAGEWNYAPEQGFIGHDEFRVRTSDGQLTRVVVMVVPAPTRRTYYVDGAHGSDKNNGSKHKAFRTIQAAESVTAPGDTVLIRNGTYGETSNEAVLLVSRSGLPDAMITYKPYPGEHPVLHTAVAWNTVLVTASYIRIEGLEIAGNAKNVPIEAAAKVAERFMKGREFESYGPETSAYQTNGILIRPANQKDPVVQMISPRHVQIVGNYVHDCQGGGISAVGSDYVTVEGNRVERNAVRTMYATSGISLFGMQNTDFEQTLYKDVIADNTLDGNETKVVWITTKKMSDGNGIILDSNRNEEPAGQPYAGRILVANNIVSESGGAGIQVYATDNTDILFNTVYRNSVTPGLNYGQIWCHKVSNVRVINNIAVAGDGAKINEKFNDTQNIVYDYNIYFGGLTPEIVGPHDVIADPRFVDLAAKNFELLPNSPAIDTALAGFGLKKDNLGHTRPYGNGFDRGALELQQ
jgi:hypothetical protein